MKPTPLPLVALFVACVGGDVTDDKSHSADVVPPMPPDPTTLIGLPPPDHTGDLVPPMPAPDHSGYIGTPTPESADSGGSGRSRGTGAPVLPGLSPLPGAGPVEKSTAR